MNFAHNYIKDISLLDKVNFQKLESLDLGDNNIDEINVFEKLYFF